MISFEFLCDFHVEVGPIVSPGPCPLGERRVIKLTGGTFEGPNMHGTVLTGGAD